MSATSEDRREFFRDLIRAGLVGGLAGLGALLALRRCRGGANASVQACRDCAIGAACPVRREQDVKT